MRAQFKTVLWALGGLAAMELLGVWFINTYERVPLDVEVGYRGEAAKNDFLAAQRYLQQLQIPAHSAARVSELPQLPATSATLFVPLERSTTGEAQQKQLLKWVRGGGHLVVTIPKKTSSSELHRDPILDPLGVTWHTSEEDTKKLERAGDEEKAYESATEYAPEQEYSSDHDPEDEDLRQLTAEQLEALDSDWQTDARSDAGSAEAGAEKAEAGPTPAENFQRAFQSPWENSTPDTLADSMLKIPFKDRPKDLQVRISQGLEDTLEQATWQAGDDDGMAILQYSVESGLVTVLADSLFLRNRHIGTLDHAELVYRLATWEHRQGEVWFIYSADQPSLFVLLWANYWGPVLLGLLLLLLWLRSYKRFGPITSLVRPSRRHLAEHIVASGRFLWRQGQHSALIDSVAQSLHRRAQKRFLGWNQLTQKRQQQLLAKSSGLTTERIAELLHKRAHSTGQMLEIINDLEKIRKAL